jgi:dephospho-CoA kinase
MFDAGWQDLVDEVWLVESPRDAVLERLRERGLAAAEAERRLAAATDPTRARKLATRTIQNDAELDTLRRKVRDAYAAATGQTPA